MLIGPLLAVVYGFNAADLGGFVTQGLLVSGLLWVVIFLHCERCSLDEFKRVIGPLVVAILLVSFVAFRPSLLEYPADHINYWQRLIDAPSDVAENASKCALGSPLSYIASCTLWLKLASASPVSDDWIISGQYAILVHFGELFLLSLSLLRLWMAQAIRSISAVCMLVLVFAGTGYLYDAFVINHALQGSILSAALLVECASVLCLIFSRLRVSPLQPMAGFFLVTAWYAVSSIYFLLALKLHGLFALLILVWILIVPIVLSVLGCLLSSDYRFPRRVRSLFGGLSMALVLILFVGKGAQNIPIPPNYAGVVIRWSDLLGLDNQRELWPVGFIPRTSDTRPEALAVLGLIASLLVIFIALAQDRPRPTYPVLHALPPGRSLVSGPLADFALLSSVYGISVFLAYTLPPFSNLFLKLNPHYSSHMRLMWGVCLISPLPVFLFVRESIALRLSSLAAMVVVLLPIQFASGQRQQLFFSKTRHFVVPTPPWSDPSQLAAALLPELNRIQEADPCCRQLRVVADPLVRSALYPFGISMMPQSRGIGGDRLFQVSQLTLDLQDDASQIARNNSSALLEQLPDVVIQQPVRDCFYSVYSDMAAYDPCIAARATAYEVNRWSPELLRQRGYFLDRTLEPSLLRIWRR